MAAAQIRPMTAQDLPRARALLAQLGYDLLDETVGRRFASVTEAAGHVLLVAEMAGQVVGLLHAFARPALEKPPEVVVQALVVDAQRRKAGIGAGLMAAAERWSADRGFASVALASQVIRDDAHAFYRKLGYQTVATSHVMRKRLAP